MERPVDLPRIRRALSELDRIAAEHPEICQGIGQWTEQAVEKMTMGTPANERASAFRRRLAEKGIKREIFFATPEARDALVQLRALHPDKTRDRILCDAVLNLLTATVAPLTAYEPRCAECDAALPDASELFCADCCPPAPTPVSIPASVDAPAPKATAVEATPDLFEIPATPASNMHRSAYLPEPATPVANGYTSSQMPPAPTDKAALMLEIGAMLNEGHSGNEIARRLNASGRRTTSGAEFNGANLLRDYRAWTKKTGTVDATTTEKKR